MFGCVVSGRLVSVFVNNVEVVGLRLGAVGLLCCESFFVQFSDSSRFPASDRESVCFEPCRA